VAGEAETEKFAVDPVHTDWLTGWLVMEGGAMGTLELPEKVQSATILSFTGFTSSSVYVPLLGIDDVYTQNIARVFPPVFTGTDEGPYTAEESTLLNHILRMAGMVTPVPEYSMVMSPVLERPDTIEGPYGVPAKLEA
jgi:hypothetical protein